ncbi:hypothetical protein [Meiothermus cerbereus]|uniref:hypothetical protein n=1 Tax=Meiothermus cerbereus TaxID=65552 RepID=UPI003EEE0AC4
MFDPRLHNLALLWLAGLGWAAGTTYSIVVNGKTYLPLSAGVGYSLRGTTPTLGMAAANQPPGGAKERK